MVNLIPPCPPGSLVHTGPLPGFRQILFKSACHSGKKLGLSEIYNQETQSLRFGLMFKDDKPVGIAYATHFEELFYFRWADSGQLIPIPTSPNQIIETRYTSWLRFGTELEYTELKDGLAHGASIRVKRLHRNEINYIYSEYLNGEIQNFSYSNPLNFDFQPKVTPLNFPPTSALQCHSIKNLQIKNSIFENYGLSDGHLVTYSNQPQCMGVTDGLQKEYRNHRVSKRWTCRNGRVSGYIEYFSVYSGTRLATAFPSPDKEMQEIVVAVNSEVLKIRVTDGQAKELCLNPPAQADLDRRLQADKSQRKSQSPQIIAGTFSYGLVDEYSGGLIFIPNAHFKDVSLSSWYLETEYLKSRDQNLMRISGGRMMMLLIYSFYGGVGIRSEGQRLESTEFTLGAGVTILNFYVRPVYRHESKEVDFSTGLKLTLPLIFF